MRHSHAMIMSTSQHFIPRSLCWRLIDSVANEEYGPPDRAMSVR